MTVIYQAFGVVATLLVLALLVGLWRPRWVVPARLGTPARWKVLAVGLPLVILCGAILGAVEPPEMKAARIAASAQREADAKRRIETEAQERAAREVEAKRRAEVEAQERAARDAEAKRRAEVQAHERAAREAEARQQALERAAAAQGERDRIAARIANPALHREDAVAVLTRQPDVTRVEATGEVIHVYTRYPDAIVITDLQAVAARMLKIMEPVAPYTQAAGYLRLWFVAAFKDSRGNTADDQALVVQVPWAEVGAINYKSVDPDMFLNLIKVTYQHPAVRAIAEHCGKHADRSRGFCARGGR